jgi:hypothetical protein
MIDKNLYTLIGAFILIIVGVAGFVGTIASEGQKVTDLTGVVDETVSLSSVRDATDGGIIAGGNVSVAQAYGSDWRISDTDCTMTGVSIKNSTGGTLTVTTDYTFDTSTGIITYVNTQDVNQSGLSNTTTVTYAYCQAGFLGESWNRTVIDLVPGFFSLALLLIGVGLFYNVMKNEKLLGV